MSVPILSQSPIAPVARFLIVSSCFVGGGAMATEHIPLSSKGIGATVLSATALNSKNARIKAKVMKQDADEYCQRDPGAETKKNGGRLSVQKCVNLYVRSDGQFVHNISADCRTKQLFSSFTNGNPYKPLKRTDEFTVWRSLVSGEERDSSTAGGGDVLTEQFNALCPAYKIVD